MSKKSIFMMLAVFVACIAAVLFYLSQYGLENVVLDEEYVYCQEKEDSIITLKKTIVTI